MPIHIHTRLRGAKAVSPNLFSPHSQDIKIIPDISVLLQKYPNKYEFGCISTISISKSAKFMELGQKGSHNIFTVANRYYCIQERCRNCPVKDAGMAVPVLLAANCFEEMLNCH